MHQRIRHVGCMAKVVLPISRGYRTEVPSEINIWCGKLKGNVAIMIHLCTLAAEVSYRRFVVAFQGVLPHSCRSSEPSLYPKTPVGGTAADRAVFTMVFGTVPVAVLP